MFNSVGLGSFDMLKVFLKQTDETDPRVLGLLGACPPFECRFGQSSDQHPPRISYGLFALVVDVSPFDNLTVSERMSNWRAL